MNLQTLGIIGVAVVIAFMWFVGSRQRSARRDFRQTFGVDPKARLVQADMGRDHNLSGQAIYADGLSGKPDALFKHGNRRIVGEFKQADVRGRIRRRDHYQITLYMGMLQSKHPQAQVEGRLVYANERHTVEFDRAPYRNLVSYRAECLALLNGAGL
jgi:hypothetical protein